VEVVRAGRYRIELRRWPREAEMALAAGIPGEVRRYTDSIAAGYGGGRAIAICAAAVNMAGLTAERVVDPATTAAMFELDLPAGPAHLHTTLRTADGAALGAYYVYVEAAGH
jgi:hypothetical protein